MKSLVKKRWKKKVSAIPLYLQISDFISSLISDGELPSQYTLPGYRQLAAMFKVSNQTILHSLHILQHMQLIRITERSKTVVMNTSVNPAASWDKFMEASTYAVFEAESSPMADTHKERLNLYMGLDKEYYFRNIFNEVLKDIRIPAVMKTSPFGLSLLREKIGEHIAGYGISASCDQIMMVTSITHGLNVLFTGLLGNKTTLLVAKPCHLQNSNLAKATRSKVAEVSTDDQGIIPTMLIKALEKYPRPILCISPDCTVPSGVITSLARRKEILSICAQAGVPIIEYTVFPQGCTLNRLPSLKSLDTGQSVIHVSQIGVSASTNPWLGWVVADTYLLQRLKGIRFNFDAHQNYLMQVAALEVFSRGLYDTYLDTLEGTRRTRQAFVKQLLQRRLGEYAIWNNDNLDSCIWLRLSKTVSVRRLYKDAVDIVFQPGWLYGEQFADRIYISPLVLSPENLELGVKSLVKLIRSQSSRVPLSV